MCADIGAHRGTPGVLFDVIWCRMDTLTGAVERITFFNAENGYTVLRLLPDGPRAGRVLRDEDALITVVGNLPELQPGEHLTLHGRWSAHRDYGQQFKAERVEQTLPASVEGIRRYLGSGLIKGVGPATAERIVAAFGERTLDVIDANPERLREVAGIGAKRVGQIRAAWAEQKAIREVMVALQGFGVSSGLAIKIYKQYEGASLQVVKTDPYRLARDIVGIGFKTADKIARAIGLPADSPARLVAGLEYALNEATDDGHVYLPEPELLARTGDLIALPGKDFTAALAELETQGRVRRDKLAPDDPPAVYLTPLALAEIGVAGRIRALIGKQDLFGTVSKLAAAFANVVWEHLLTHEPDTRGLTEEQARAVRLALTSKVCVLTGGPGVGKTTTLRAVVALVEARGHTVTLCSPTGRAAKRLSEATGRPAKTLHRTLEFNPGEGSFSHGPNNPLPADLIIVDEVSMLDLIMANHLFKAIHPAAHVLLVGDVDQLPSVGAGDVLRDLVRSGAVPVARLTQVFRQAAESDIIANAHRVNQGESPQFPRESGDFFLFVEDDPERAAERVVEVVAERIPRRFGLDPLRDVQVLTPMRRGDAGVNRLNEKLQAALNPPGYGKIERAFAGRTFRVGDRLMQIRNDHRRGVYNGDLGLLTALDLEAQTLIVQFDAEREIVYDFADADQLTPAYAVSIHKSQGSEYPAVVIPLVTQHYLLLQRNLLYTAITRARKLCVLVGSRRAMAIAVANAEQARRYSGLAVRLRG